MAVFGCHDVLGQVNFRVHVKGEPLLIGGHLFYQVSALDEALRVEEIYEVRLTYKNDSCQFVTIEKQTE